ncbi:hypothetical protein G7Z17_g3245 [Cylindrodendrum hubeiense]|uniref:Uncharacterized protein n=1 Tax=Cylindrodendrum hubeiense TaxID=595255 RepID=A0A9P5LDS6_9HYPO|nr:hypothetical protein G7Z17_g3245 [Cylindrodendrum hubeiense]
MDRPQDNTRVSQSAIKAKLSSIWMSLRMCRPSLYEESVIVCHSLSSCLQLKEKQQRIASSSARWMAVLRHEQQLTVHVDVQQQDGYSADGPQVDSSHCSGRFAPSCGRQIQHDSVSTVLSQIYDP